MNAPLLPPLAPCPAPGSAERVIFKDELLGRWTAGFSVIKNDQKEPFFRPCDPLALPDAQFAALSPEASRLLGLEGSSLASDPGWLKVLSGSAAPSHIQPYAAVYAGHQFGVFVPRLGDGRALNLGAINGWELQIKGAGPTPYSRFADGRAVLRSSIREFLCSEAMHALGVPTTRALSLVVSPAPVLRETVETAAVVCRLAPHFVRFGQFEYFSSQGRTDLLEQLIRWTADRQLPAQDLAEMPIKEVGLRLLNDSAQRTGELMAHWMAVGFMHGVMNTDNFSILGLTLDYGPFGFLEAFDPAHICNHSDHSGRYAYHAQPQAGLWNVSKLASSFHGVVADVDALTQSLETFKNAYARTITGLIRSKFGLQNLPQDQWEPLLNDFFSLMQTQKMDYSLSFRALCSDKDEPLLDLALDRESLRPWIARYRKAEEIELKASSQSASSRYKAMKQTNPKYILRNWVAEQAIRAMADRADSSVMEDVFKVLRSPFDEHPEHEQFARPAPDWARDLSVSCSS